MLNEFLQILPLPTNQLTGVYDLRLVALSFMVAVFASYIALDLTGRLRDINNTKSSSMLWLIGGSIAMGAGIWSMHFIGMLSFKIPGLELQYDLFWTGLSLLVAIVASAFALYLLKISIINVVHLLAGGIVLGLAIASMHYTGMEAMLITLNIKYLPSLFFLSILIAIVASEAAIWLALKSTKVVLKFRNRMKIASAIIMGLAICGMHYTAMSASVFTPLCAATLLGKSNSLDPTILSMTIAAITFVILGIAYLASTYKEAINQQQFEKARQLGMAEISASVLHNVGNVLNSVSVSTNIIAEMNTATKISGLEKLCALMNEHKDDLANFIKHDARGMKVLQYLNTFAKDQREEKDSLATVINTLSSNVNHIKNIIATQQNLSKTIGFENITSINDLLDEAVLITYSDMKNNIVIKKKYENINSVLTDKVKLLQVFVNVLLNSKDALTESTTKNKILTLRTSIINMNKIAIEIQDNGIGISAKNLETIFNFGFTTKKTGHGFGLHACALSINELGGEIRATSNGAEQGASFIIELPYNSPR